MKISSFFIFVISLPQIKSEVYSNGNGVVLEYSMNFRNKCRSQSGRYVFLQGLSITQCVEECALRPKCAALNYRRRFKLCELFSAAEEGDTFIGDCIFMKTADINVLQKPCGVCNDREMCDVGTQSCLVKECLPLIDPENGKVMGNKHDIGARRKIVCNEINPNITEVVCLSNGQWSETVNCTKECKDTSSIPHGLIARVSQGSDQASVTCDTGYQGNIATISCKPNGNWEPASCDPISCGIPTPVANGNIVSYTGTVYMETASVSCNTNFQASSNTITCLSSGDWSTFSCTPVDCFVNDVWDYAGTRNITPSGYPCDLWTNHLDDNRVNVQWMPETTVADAKNYCRQPTGNSWNIWCFSTKPNTDYELCGISKC